MKKQLILFKIMVKRLSAVQNVQRARPLLQVLLKLFRFSVKISRVQEVLIEPEIGAMSVFLKSLQLCLDSESDSNQAPLTEQLLDVSILVFILNLTLFILFSILVTDNGNSPFKSN